MKSKDSRRLSLIQLLEHPTKFLTERRASNAKTHDLSHESPRCIMMNGIVLEGGAMRGMYTAGVLDVLMEHGIEFDGMIGVSAGAVFGVNYLSKQIGRVIRYNKRFNSDKDYLGLRPLVREGNIVSTEYAYHRVPRELDTFDDETFKKSEIPFYAVVTNIKTGKPEYIKITSVFEQMDVLRASGSMPFLSKPVELNGQQYLDGGIADSIPFEQFAHMGYTRQVIILTRDINYVKKPMNAELIWAFYRKYPAFAQSLRERHSVYNNKIERIKELEKANKVFVIRPSEPILLKKIEKDPEKLQEVYNLGVSDAKIQLEQLRTFLKSITHD